MRFHWIYSRRGWFTTVKMSTDGENAKNQSSELDDSKPNLDSTDSSQESSQDAVKSEVEDTLNKSDDAVVAKIDEKPVEPEKVEKKEEKPEKPEVNDKDKDKVKEEPEIVEKKVDDEKENKKEKETTVIKEETKKNQDKTDDDTEEGDNSEEPEDEEEEEEEDDEDDEDDDKKDVPLLDQPLEQSGPRERKKVQRFDKEYTGDQKEQSMIKTDIPEGAGTQLGDIARIDASISRFKTDDLKLLHRVLFKNPGKAIQIKKNIRKFNGFDFDKESEEYGKKLSSLQKLEIKQLKSICEMLDLGKTGNKEEIAERVCEFLLEPKDSGKPSAGGRPKRTAAVRANNRGYSSHEDADASDSDTPRSRSKRGKGRRVNLKEESSSDEEFNPSDSEDEEGKPRVKKTGRGRPSLNKKKTDTDDEISDVEETPSSDDSEEPKAKKKRGPVAKVQNNKNKKPPAKSPGRPGRKPANSTPAKKTPAKRGRKKKQESSDEEQDSEENNAASSSEDEPLIKKNKSPQPPSDEEIKTYVKEILEGANLEEITMKTVCKQVYAHYPDFDLAHKKDFIKTTVKSLIST